MPKPPSFRNGLAQEAAERAHARRYDYEIAGRLIAAGLAALGAWLFFPGSYVFDKGLATLTAGEAGYLVLSAWFVFAALKSVFGP